VGTGGFHEYIQYLRIQKWGALVLHLHSPHGGNPANESVFEQIEPLKKVVIHHISEPRYRLTVDLTPSATGTVVSWSQEFESPEVAHRIEKIVLPANEQNLDRLTAEVLVGGNDPVTHSGV